MIMFCSFLKIDGAGNYCRAIPMKSDDDYPHDYWRVQCHGNPSSSLCEGRKALDTENGMRALIKDAICEAVIKAKKVVGAPANILTCNKCEGTGRETWIEGGATHTAECQVCDGAGVTR